MKCLRQWTISPFQHNIQTDSLSSGWTFGRWGNPWTCLCKRLKPPTWSELKSRTHWNDNNKKLKPANTAALSVNATHSTAYDVCERFTYCLFTSLFSWFPKKKDFLSDIRSCYGNGLFTFSMENKYFVHVHRLITTTTRDCLVPHFMYIKNIRAIL